MCDTWVQRSANVVEGTGVVLGTRPGLADGDVPETCRHATPCWADTTWDGPHYSGCSTPTRSLSGLCQHHEQEVAGR